MAGLSIINPEAVPGTIKFSQNSIPYTVEASAPGREVQFKLYVETEHYKRDYQLVITTRKPALADRSCTFMLQGILDTVLNNQAEVPQLLQEPISAFCKQGILNYVVTWAEIDPETGLAGVLITSELNTVIRGGLPEELRHSVAFFNDHLPASKQFMTWAPPIRKVTLEQPEFLYFLNLEEEETELRVRRTYTAESGIESTEEVVPMAAAFDRKYRLLQIPALAGINGFHRKIEVFVVKENDTAISETRVYKIEENLAGTDRFFLFENSLGGFDTLRTTGDSEISLDGKDELAERDPGNDAHLGQYFVYSRNIDRKIKQASGFHDRSFHEYLQDFLYAKRRFVLERNLVPADLSARLVPIILKKRSYTFQPQRRLPIGFIFEYDYAFETTAYARF